MKKDEEGEIRIAGKVERESGNEELFSRITQEVREDCSNTVALFSTRR